MLDSSSNKLVLLGGGGHCRSVSDSLYSLGIYVHIVVTDTYLPIGYKINGCEVVGDDDILETLYDRGYYHGFIAVGGIKITSARRELYEKALSIGFLFPTVIDPSCVVAVNSEVMEGVYVGKRAIINSSCFVGSNAIVNTGAIIEHNCHIGEFSHISVGATVCGDCVIGHDTFVGANATIIQGIRIGANSIIGAGSVILADVPENTTAIGVWKGRQNE